MARFADIADDLRLRIERGEWPVGGELSPVRELATHYGVSPTTANKAVQRLATIGYVQVNYSSGTVVCDRAATRTPLMIGAYIGYDPVMGYIYNPAAGDWVPTTMPTRARVPARRAGAEVVELLGVAPTDTVLARRRVVGPRGGRAEQITTTWFRPGLVEQMDVDDTGPGGWMQQLEQPADVVPGGRGLGPLTWRCLVSSRPATGEEASALRLGTHAGVLVLMFPVTPQGWPEPVAVDVMVFDERRYRVEHAVPRAKAARWPVTPVPGRNVPLPTGS